MTVEYLTEQSPSLQEVKVGEWYSVYFDNKFNYVCEHEHTYTVFGEGIEPERDVNRLVEASKAVVDYEQE